MDLFDYPDGQHHLIPMKGKGLNLSMSQRTENLINLNKPIFKKDFYGLSGQEIQKF